jgi:hypothetical protein
MTRNFYMHTIDGRPGQFQPSAKSVCYAGKSCTRLATSLTQIRKEQKIDRANASPNCGTYELGYVRIPAYVVLK